MEEGLALSGVYKDCDSGFGCKRQEILIKVD